MTRQASMLESDKLPTLHKYARAYRDADNDVGLATTARDDARKRIVAYLLMYEGRAVGNPYIAQLASAPRQLVRGSRPMTLFLVSSHVRSSALEAADAPAWEWLTRAWQKYRAVCAS